VISCTTASFSRTCHNVIKLKSYLVTDFCSSSSFPCFSLDISSICEACKNRGCLSVCLTTVPVSQFSQFPAFLLRDSLRKLLVPSACGLFLWRFVPSSSSFIHSPVIHIHFQLYRRLIKYPPLSPCFPCSLEDNS